MLRNQSVEAERQLASLRGEQDATCAEAFQLGIEEIRTKIAREHPEWDLSFLEDVGAEACTPEPEEVEYADLFYVDFDAILGPSGTEDPDGRPKFAGGGALESAPKFETGEPSRVSSSVADKTVESAPVPGP